MAVGKFRADEARAEPQKILPESASAPETTEGCKREGASTVSLNHPLAANS